MRIFIRHKFLTLAGLILAAGITWIARQDWTEPKSAPGVRFGTVKRGDLIQRVTVAGEVTPARRTVFVAPYSGYIQKIFVGIGDKVKSGSPVLSITPSLQNPETVYPIRAPFGGTVVGINKSEGEFVSEKDPKDIIVRIDDLSSYFVVAKAPETDAARIKNGMPVEVKINAIHKESLQGIVRSIELAAEQADGWKSQQSTFKVTVEIVKPPADVRSGQSALIDIVIKKFPGVLFLEHEFINKDGDEYFAVDRKGRRRNIEVGDQSDMAAEIRAGLKEGEQVEQVNFLKLLESGG